MKGAQKTEPSKQPSQPKKFSAFSGSDSKALETRYQKLLEASEDAEPSGTIEGNATKDSRTNQRSRHVNENQVSKDGANVLVNEDYLFDVNIPQRELAPVYWLGPVYEGWLFSKIPQRLDYGDADQNLVRRGTWFFNEGSSLKPCEENLAAQLEEVRHHGYQA